MSRVNGLNVFRSKDCGYEHVGMIEFTPGSVLFQYDGGYIFACRSVVIYTRTYREERLVP